MAKQTRRAQKLQEMDEVIMVIIRKAKREDCKAIRSLIQELADFERMPDGPKINSEVLEKDGFDTDHPLFICYVAEIDRNVVGYAISYYTYSTWGGKAMYLEDLYVTPNNRREHVGSKLLRAVAKEAVDNSCCRLDFSVLKWNPARDFYKSKGAIDITEEEEWHHYRFTNEALKILATDSSYLFSSRETLLARNMIGKISVPEEHTLHKDDVKLIDDDDSDLLSHSQMSWDDIGDRYVPYEVLSNESVSTTPESSTTSDLSFTLLDQVPFSADQKVIQCATGSNWNSFILDIDLWEDDKAPVVKLRELCDVTFDDLEFCGFLTDRLIGVSKSYLTKSPENGLYVLSKCVMRDMSLSHIVMLRYHRYLQYIDLAYNHISTLLPLKGIPYLMFLNASHNRINIILDFSPPWYLTYVNLSFNYISKMRDISEFWSIVHLDLSHNAIEIISGLQNLKYLKYLNLSYNLIERIENLDKLNIQELNLEGNCILTYKSAMPGYGISSLSDLRKIYLGYNKLTTLEFLKDAYSLRVIDLKFNKVDDLLELQNCKGLIQEMDLRGNGCTRWPNYKAVILFSIPSIQRIDGVEVTSAEKIAAVTSFASPVNLAAARTVTKLTLLEQLSTPKIDLHVTPYDEGSPPLIILTGPSAVQKLSLALHIVRTLLKKVVYCRWYTTKKGESNESESQSYIFVDREKFNDMSRRGEFLAIQEELGHSYGFHCSEIALLKLEKKIGITQTDLHATIQLTMRYSNSKPVLVLTKSEEVHSEWIQEKFDIQMYTKYSKENIASKETAVTESDLKFIKGIVNDTVQNLKLPNKIRIADVDLVANIYDSNSYVDEDIFRDRSVLHKKNVGHIKFQEEIDSVEDNRICSQVILDEYSNIVIEDAEVKRKRHQAKLLQRRNTLILGGITSPTDQSDSGSSDEVFVERKPLEIKKPEHMKNYYTELILKSRKIYLDQHMNNPGFFSLVVLTDEYIRAYNKLINFIFNVYTNFCEEKPKFLSELNHFSEVAIPAMIEPIVNEIKQSLSSSVLQRRTLLRNYGVTSWKDLMPSQVEETMIDHIN
ncbi:uncharacterized protein LOC108630659 [Ceratina calcarata]|uniref:Uncharacterized protein LOC108630659 n=1 Tax=Ceratina calcarata TaxID=156304 RepID=A0AAJ7JCS8_9HYME|nr:uncharacterized protein LOC108630659 [Ceratina calcarata]